MTKPLTVGSLFAGIGGFDLAAESIGWRTAWFVEYDANCQHWLAANFPGVPIHGDITTLDFSHLEPVDVLCGGFPCQPASAAGKRLGTADDRWLWPHFARAIGALRPRYVVAENVPGLLSVNGGRAFAEVLRDLAALGYDAEWDGLSAGDVGSPQERERVWIVAYARRGRDDERADEREAGGARQQSVLANAADGGANMGHASSAGWEERDAAAITDGSRHAAGERIRVGDPASGGRRTGSGLDVRRAERGCEGVGHATDDIRRPDGGSACRGESSEESEACCRGVRSGNGCAGDDGSPTASVELGDADRERFGERRESERAELESASGTIAHRSSAAPWADAVPVRGADGTVRLIPREAAEQGPQSEVRALAHGLPDELAGQQSASLWPVCEGEAGRVARLRAIGNTVVPQCVIEGPFAVIQQREAYAESL